MGETCEWLAFDDAVLDQTGRSTKVQRRNLKSVGDIPVVDQGQEPIAGYTDKRNAYQGVSPVVLFGDHTRAFKFIDFDFAIGADGVKVLEPQPGLDAKFLYYYLRSLRIESAGYSRHFKFLREFQIPKPHESVQRRIVDLLTRAEGIVRLRREAAAKAAELIPAMFIDMFGDPAKNPKHWPTRPLGELATPTSGGTPSKSRPDYWEGDLPWVSPKDMKRDLISDAIDHVHSRVLDETTLKLIPAGTVLIVVRGMILVHTVPVALTATPVVINQDMKALQLRSELSSTYLLWLLKVSQPRLLELVSTAAHGTKKLETKDLVALKIPLPPLALQQKFLAHVQAIESMLTQQADAIAKAQATFNALLAQAFASPTPSASNQE